MKRDLELIKEILLYFERRDSDKLIDVKHIINESDVAIKGFDGRLVSDHIDIMYEAGLLEGEAEKTKTGRLIQVYPSRLTWDGHEFISAAKNDSAWRRLMTKVKNEGGSMPLKVVQSLLLKYFEMEAGL